MTAREQFTDEEWAKVVALPGQVVSAATLSDGKTMPSVREIAAGGGALMEGIKRYPENPVLKGLLADAGKSDLGAKRVEPTSADQIGEVLLTQVEEGSPY